MIGSIGLLLQPPGSLGFSIIYHNSFCNFKVLFAITQSDFRGVYVNGKVSSGNESCCLLRRPHT